MRIGIDLGGTKTEVVALAADGTELRRRRVKTPASYVETLATIQDLVRWIEQVTGRTGTVGVGIPGTLSSGTDLVKNANSTWLIGHPLRHDLETALRRSVRVANDANCFALAEASEGAGSEADVVFGVILGTGVGGGVVVGGRVWVGANRVAGEWGHVPLPWPDGDERPGPPCYCGRFGCIETFLSGPGMAADHERQTGLHATTHEIVEAASARVPAAVSTLQRYVDRLARSLGVVINLLDPDVVVLGGGMSNLPNLTEAVQDGLAPWVFSDTVVTQVVMNQLGDSSGVYGAAWLWPEP